MQANHYKQRLLKHFPESIKFKYSWRKYQKRVLDELDEHLSDSHLHIVAPPGSGKTILGIEVALRLNKPTLILAPTLAIRNQWIQRFCELFLLSSSVPNWISTDIRQPEFMTVVTYQGLHSACSNSKEEGVSTEVDQQFEAIIKGLKAVNIKTIVVDEAHHLKNEWWNTLTKVKEALEPVIVGLTATPPYDVSALEWQRYINLNGPIDSEITVPELVVEGDLCPHQDYIYFSLPTAEESESINLFRKNAFNIFNELKSDEVLIEAIMQHPIWQNPLEHLEWIYTNLPIYSSFIIFLNENNREIPEVHFEVIGDKELNIPQLNYSWLEILLDFYLYKEKAFFNEYEEHKEILENKLKRKGTIEKQKISFSQNTKITKAVTSSMSKLESIQQIIAFEYAELKHKLRLVVLTDFIRKEYFIDAAENDLPLNKMGVMPIFEKIRRENHSQIKIAVLTGSIIILPRSAYTAFEEKAKAYEIENINFTVVPFDKNYLLIHQTEQLKDIIIHLITEVFQEGKIEVLIGTKALLGEGWDAPAINSLILASFVGSFVLSNQMRGRAIRTQRDNPDKTGNIWHLACVDPSDTKGGDDLNMLRRRFKSFVRVSLKDENRIENGVARLNFPEQLSSKKSVIEKNNETLSYAKERAQLKDSWNKAIAIGSNLVEEVKIPLPPKLLNYQEDKKLFFNRTILYLISDLFSSVLVFGEFVLSLLGRTLRFFTALEKSYYWIQIIGIMGLIFFSKKAYTAFKLYIKYRDISKDIHQIGEVVLNSLIEAKLVTTYKTELRVVSIIEDGCIYNHLEGGSSFEKTIFIDALQEIIRPIDNPRYIIIRKSETLFFNQRDYHSVPEVIGLNKKLATHFEKHWKENVGDCELVYTRTIEGRKLLLKSRIKALASQFEDGTERINKWV